MSYQAINHTAGVSNAATTAPVDDYSFLKQFELGYMQPQYVDDNTKIPLNNQLDQWPTAPPAYNTHGPHSGEPSVKASAQSKPIMQQQQAWTQPTHQPYPRQQVYNKQPIQYVAPPNSFQDLEQIYDAMNPQQQRKISMYNLNNIRGRAADANATAAPSQSSGVTPTKLGKRERDDDTYQQQDNVSNLGMNSQYLNIPLGMPSNKRRHTENIPNNMNLMNAMALNTGYPNVQQVRAQKNHQADKNKKEKHNEVEKRRREGINTEIDNIGALIPEKHKPEKKSKGTILRAAAHYIEFLHEDMQALRQEILTLKDRIRELNETIKAQFPASSGQVSLPL